MFLKRIVRYRRDKPRYLEFLAEIISRYGGAYIKKRKRVEHEIGKLFVKRRSFFIFIAIFPSPPYHPSLSSSFPYSSLVAARLRCSLTTKNYAVNTQSLSYVFAPERRAPIRMNGTFKSFRRYLTLFKRLSFKQTSLYGLLYYMFASARSCGEIIFRESCRL